MRKTAAIVMITFVATVVLFFWWTAENARKRSDITMAKFKEVEALLRDTAKGKDNKNGIGAVETRYADAEMRSSVIFLIDSLKDSFQTVIGKNKMSEQLTLDCKRLLQNIQSYNKLQWSFVDSATPDTIAYWSSADPFRERKWLSEYFTGKPREVSITYLNYLKNQVTAR